MPRRSDADLRKDWKISLPATLAGSVEFELMDPMTKKPRYAERSRLIAALLAEWLAKRGKVVEVDMPAEDLFPGVPQDLKLIVELLKTLPVDVDPVEFMKTAIERTRNEHTATDATSNSSSHDSGGSTVGGPEGPLPGPTGS